MLKLNKNVGHTLRANKAVNVLGSDFALTGGFSEFVRFTKSWETLGLDNYYGQADRGARYRSYSDFEYDPASETLTRLEHRAYEQSTEHNRYVGGMVRHFDDVSAEIFNSAVLQALVKLDFEVYKEVLPEALHSKIWQCQIHQIRIEINPGAEIEITPEGIHCDGYPFSAVHFWGRENVEGAMSQVFTKEEKLIDSGTYRNILDTTFFLDRELLHYVTTAFNPTKDKMGYRQIIAISFSRPGTDYDIIK
ncbi:2OG-Fe dioxygenase family protein [Candidatus Pantoea multigeneris]|uniref:2OG-Fe dioxygenase family protein n=1 Tax=Candidatus Pantoea multigeneris TaxID=2608357 RepID=A0ABX0RBE8_9GAMM|nr:2OG-Fe dioxygenase family protein [Pantoea multigeneris]NIF22407.1 2OG-Fe dioxygenase family protein [Pantoea multigeneris]